MIFITTSINIIIGTRGPQNFMTAGLGTGRMSFGASLSEPRIHEVQEAVLYVYILYVCGVIISVRRELNFERFTL